MPPGPPLEIKCQDVKRMLDASADFLLLDCREADEHAIVNIPQAKLLPMSEIAERLDELVPHQKQEIVVHCHHGGRSVQVALWLRKQGFSDAKSLAGGIDAWALEIDRSLARY
jgi:rhodanese-related sulfurtransferase